MAAEGWAAARPRWVWPAAGLGAAAAVARISTSAYYAGENGLFSWSLPALASPCGWHITGQESASLAAALPHLTASAGEARTARGGNTDPSRQAHPPPLNLFPRQSPAQRATTAQHRGDGTGFPSTSRAKSPTATRIPRAPNCPRSPPAEQEEPQSAAERSALCGWLRAAGRRSQLPACK